MFPVQLKKENESFVSFKVAMIYRWFSETALREQKVFQGLSTSIAQQNLDAITKGNGEWGDDLSRYQPDNGVWTQPIKNGLSC